MFSEKFAQFVSDKNAFTAGLMVEADSQIKNLQSCLDDARATIAAMKSKKCPKCGASLPADGSLCILCKVRKMPKTNSESYRLGIVTTALAYAMARQAGLTPDSIDPWSVIIDGALEQEIEIDRAKAVEAIQGKLQVLAGKGCYMGRSMPFANYLDDLIKKYCV